LFCQSLFKGSNSALRFCSLFSLQRPVQQRLEEVLRLAFGFALLGADLS